MTGKERPAGSRRRLPTLVDVANKAGVSTATVSRAFSRPTLLREDTAAWIFQVADELGYSPNGAGRALARGKFDVIAMVVPNISNAYYPPIIKVVQDRASESGFAVLLGDSDGDAAREQGLLARLVGQVDGLIIVDTLQQDSELRGFSSSRATVLIDSDVDGVSRVLTDPDSAMREAVQHLRGLRHTRILHISTRDPSWSNTCIARTLRSLEDEGEVQIVRYSAAASSLVEGGTAADHLISAGATAAIVGDDILANGLLIGLRARGLTVPRDVSVISCRDLRSGQSDVPLTAVSTPVLEIGRTVVNLLKRMDSDADLPDQRIVMQSSLIYRQSTSVAYGTGVEG